ncbi:MAG: transposase [Ectothiorhodospiraceae bacterium]|nr:transposase [Ectothiorhodospiraceae bacterium]
MPRRARISIPGVPWHIIQRGNNRSDCFYADKDYKFYLYHLKELSEKFCCDVHSYVLMTNHVHLLLTPKEEDSAAKLMKNLGQRYVQYINRTYKRSGTLWEGRFRSCLTQSDEYVMACYRYIELNPVKANMVNHPRDYRWSSYKANAEGKKNDLITPHNQYLQMDHRILERRKAYRGLFKTHVNQPFDDEIRSATNGNFVLGSKKFQDEIESKLGRRVVRGKAGRPKKDEPGK